MKTISKITLLLILIMILKSNTIAQNYTALGLRLGGQTSGITLKSFTGYNTAMEGILSLGSNSFLITGLYEMHSDFNNAPGLKFVYGLGGHIGFFEENGRYYGYDNRRIVTSTSIVGMDFILGLDYKFNNAPINIGMDIKPFIDFFDGTTVFFDGAVSIRFVF